jgi:hypothetical protein
MVQDNFHRSHQIDPTPPAAANAARPRLSERLLQARDYRLTLLQAGTGYGKSTALAALTQTGQPLVWYQLHGEDSDPFVSLLHLLHGFINEGAPVPIRRWPSLKHGSVTGGVPAGRPFSTPSATIWPKA